MADRTYESVDSAEKSAGAELMTTPEYARRVRRSVSTIRYWRRKGYGPSGFRLGKHVVFLAADVEAFIAEARGKS